MCINVQVPVTVMCVDLCKCVCECVNMECREGGDVYSKFLCKLVPKSVPLAKKEREGKYMKKKKRFHMCG